MEILVGNSFTDKLNFNLNEAHLLQSFVVEHRVQSTNTTGQVAEHLHLMLAVFPSSGSSVFQVEFVSHSMSAR